MDRHRVEDDVHGPLAADLTDLWTGVGDALEALEHVSLRTTVFVDGHTKEASNLASRLGFAGCPSSAPGRSRSALRPAPRRLPRSCWPSSRPGRRTRTRRSPSSSRAARSATRCTSCSGSGEALRSTSSWPGSSRTPAAG